MKNLLVYLSFFLLLSCGPISGEDIDPDTDVEETETQQESGEEEVDATQYNSHLLFEVDGEKIHIESDKWLLGEGISTEYDDNPNGFSYLSITALKVTTGQRIGISITLNVNSVDELKKGAIFKNVEAKLNIEGTVEFVKSGGFGMIFKETFDSIGGDASNEKTVYDGVTKILSFDSELKDWEEIPADFELKITEMDPEARRFSGTFSFSAYDGERDILVAVTSGEFNDLSW